MKTFIQYCLLIISLGAASILHADSKLIHAGQLLAIAGDDVLTEQSVYVEKGKIVSVESGYKDISQYPAGTEYINLKDYFVMAGLMDMHVHLQGELGPNNDSEELKESDPLVGMKSVWHAKKTLMAGFTTVRDVGSKDLYMFALRDAINNGWLEGPRIIAAGGVAITGGHSDVSGIRPELMHFYSDESICDGPYDCRRATRNAIKYGADLIKITSTGGVMTDRKTGTGQQMEMDELKEVVMAAKRMGRKVASHAHQEDGIVAALEAGVASIEHGTYTGEKAIKLFKKTGAYLVPTLLAGDTVKNIALNSNYMSEAIREKAIRVGTDMQGNFAKAYKAGVNIAFGTDSGISRHGTNAQEAVLMHKAGMPVMEILKSATVNAADLIDMTSQLGTIEVGKHADIIAMNQSPLDDVQQLLDIDFVMRSGTVYKDVK
ncbi:MAG: amidohydrolase family protein [Gammaproteobacteria bacterium]